MENLHGFEFFPLTFDQDGRLLAREEWTRVQARASTATDVVLLAHGFRNSEEDAKGLYTEFLGNLRAHLDGRSELSAVGQRDIIVAGVFWPSLAFRESFATDEGGVQSADDAGEREQVRSQLLALQASVDSPGDKNRLQQALALVDRLEQVGVQDQFVDLVLGTVRETEPDLTEGLLRVKSKSGSELLSKLSIPIVQATAASEMDGGVTAATIGLSIGAGLGDGGVQGFGSFVGSVFGQVGRFLNLTTWYQMKERSGTVGANGVASCVRELKALKPDLKVHLIGHSLGGRLMAACAKSLATAPACEFESLMLLQAAFSHYGLSTDNGAGTRGFFRDVLERKVVTGPMIATFSFQDEVVGRMYSIASRLAGDNVKEIGDPNDPFGGIGRNGPQRLAANESAQMPLQRPGGTYVFAPRVLHCLDGSGGLIKNHSDVKNPEVTFAFASALAQT